MLTGEVREVFVDGRLHELASRGHLYVQREIIHTRLTCTISATVGRWKKSAFFSTCGTHTNTQTHTQNMLNTQNYIHLKHATYVVLEIVVGELHAEQFLPDGKLL